MNRTHENKRRQGTARRDIHAVKWKQTNHQTGWNAFQRNKAQPLSPTHLYFIKCLGGREAAAGSGGMDRRSPASTAVHPVPQDPAFWFVRLNFIPKNRSQVGGKYVAGETWMMHPRWMGSPCHRQAVRLLLCSGATPRPKYRFLMFSLFFRLDTFFFADNESESPQGGPSDIGLVALMGLTRLPC